MSPSKLMPLLVPYVATIIGLGILRNAWVAILLYHFGVLVILIPRRRELPLGRLLTGWRHGLGFASVAVSVLAGPLLLLLWPIIQIGEDGAGAGSSLAASLAALGLAGWTWILFCIYFCTIHPLLEEIYWRGLLAERHAGLSWTDFAFAGYHGLVLRLFVDPLWVVASVIVLVLVAWSWRQLGRRSGGLRMPLATHVVGDWSVIIAAYFILS